MTDMYEAREPHAWLSPSAALSRFKPSSEDFAEGKSLEIDPKRYGIFIGSVAVLLPADTVSEVIEQQEIYPLPNTAPFFQGLINFRGNLVPIFDFRELLETRADGDRKRMLLVIDKGEAALGLSVDGYPVSSTFTEPLGQTPPVPEAIREFIQAAYLDDERVWIDMDIRAFAESLASSIGI